MLSIPTSSPNTTNSTASCPSVEVTVDSLGGLGDGIASVGGKPLFIPKSTPGDRLRVRIVHENRDGMHGQVERVLSPGDTRQIPPCPYFDRCGGCTLQQLVPSYYQEFKTRMLHAALTHAGFDFPQAQVTFLPASTRRRVEFKASHADGKVTLAFHVPRSHTPVEVDSCHILRPELQAMIAPLNEALSALPFAADLYAVSLTLADSGMDLLLTFRDSDLSSLPSFDNLCKTLNLARISVRTREGKPRIMSTRQPVEMTLGGYAIPLPPDAFLQATSEGQHLLAEAALAACKGATAIADLFCGIGTYSFAASRMARTHAVEGDAAMTRAMQQSVKRHGITSLSCEQRDLFKNPLAKKELDRFDAVIINPPRLGAKAQCEALVQSGIRQVAMVSCNPATFARDVKILKDGGFELVSVQGIDQFVYSPHLELTALLRRKGA